MPSTPEGTLRLRKGYMPSIYSAAFVVCFSSC
uniref:Uncharacterized protein n=1 Tax=Lotus japonicus TaxID=34305 RepID=I3S2H2_LOTJA|nr:unknown [Lotus japonicus]